MADAPAMTKLARIMSWSEFELFTGLVIALVAIGIAFVLVGVLALNVLPSA
jgi:hypothetical protein